MRKCDHRRRGSATPGPGAAEGWVWAVVALATLTLARPAAAQEVPADIQAALVLKLLDYDRKLAVRSPNGVMLVAVIGAEGTAAGARFKALEKQRVQGRQIKVELLPADEARPLKAALSSLSANAIYLGSKIEADRAKQAIAWADENQVPTFGGTRKLAEQGAAIGFMVTKGKPRFVVNMVASRKQRIELPSRVLRLADLIW